MGDAWDLSLLLPCSIGRCAALCLPAMAGEEGPLLLCGLHSLSCDSLCQGALCYRHLPSYTPVVGPSLHSRATGTGTVPAAERMAGRMKPIELNAAQPPVEAGGISPRAHGTSAVCAGRGVSSHDDDT